MPTMNAMTGSPHTAPGPRPGRDRHGRGHRGPMSWPPTPGARSRSELFDELVLDALERIERRLPGGLSNVELAVELVPPSDPAPWEPAQVSLSRLFPAEGGMPARVVLYRRPIETRATDPRDLPGLVNDIVVEQIAGALGVEPITLDPEYRGEDD